ncbi:hypothetical protein PAHAL_7G094300 [Panicum hallii]|uniref:Uncharacterized protein n=1 Tax=Panicum hallii TaxID=206008 RepID=A0A2T8IBK4_9POAL|nr:hypothetical protein PAHAL_7G094300 [Panicum hallii]
MEMRSVTAYDNPGHRLQPPLSPTPAPSWPPPPPPLEFAERIVQFQQHADGMVQPLPSFTSIGTEARHHNRKGLPIILEAEPT